MELLATVLGEVGISADGRTADLGGPRQRRLFGALIGSRGHIVSTDRLIEAVFEGNPPEGASRTFRTYVSRLRRALEAGGIDSTTVVVTSAPGYVIPETALQVDSALFEAGFEEAQDRFAVGESDGALQRLDEALSLWTGSAYGEFAHEEWAQADSIRLEELRLAAQELRAEAKIESGRHNAAIPDLEALIAEHPLREGPRRLEVLALYRSGRHAEALRAARDFRSYLAAETGLNPTSELDDLEQMVIERDPRLDAKPQGRKLRGYVLGEPVHEGAHGITFRAAQPSVGRDVAITVVPADLADDPSFVRQFETHAQRIAAIEHPNVVPLYDYWREPGGAYLVTRFLGGGSLRDRIDDPDVVTRASVEQIVSQIGAALSAAHGRGVTHGHLTEDNIVFDDGGTAHLTEFGVATDHRSTPGDIEALGRLAEGLWARASSAGVSARSTEPGQPTGDDGLQVVFRRAVAAEDSSLGYPTVQDFVDDFRQSIAGERGAGAERLTGGSPELAIEGPNPFRGLYPFQESDSAVFFGRTAIIDELIDDLSADRFVALVGPSGSGKSSVIRAGVVPRLRREGGFVATLTPGRSPLAELSLALSRVAAHPVPDLAEVLGRDVTAVPKVLNEVLDPPESRVLLIIDQFEEAFTLAPDHERALFLEGLVHALQSGGCDLRVALTVRADFLGLVLNDPIVGSLVGDHSRLIAPLTPNELHEAIVGPAEAVGVAVEPAVASALVADSSGSPGSLPLLQFALTELYEHRVDGTMTVDAYDRFGGLSAVLGQRAEEIYGQLLPSAKATCPHLFGRLINIDAGVEDTKRRALRSELASVSNDVLERFGAARLVSFDRDPETREPTVELAHEALIREWPRLRTWLEGDRDGLRILRHLTASSEAWHDRGRDSSELYRGGRLEAAAEWSESHRAELSTAEAEFLDASLAQHRLEVDAERDRLRRLRTLLGVVAVVAVLALVAGGVAAVQRGRANDERARAELNARLAEENEAQALAEAERADVAVIRSDVERLVVQSDLALNEDPDLALLLAIQAFEQSLSLDETPGVVAKALQVATQESRLIDRRDGASPWLGVSPDGQVLASGTPASETEVTLSDIRTGQELTRLGVGHEVGNVAFSPDGLLLAVTFSVPTVGADGRSSSGRLYDTENYEPVADLVGPCCAPNLRFSPDGRFLAATVLSLQGEPTVATWDLRAPEAEPQLLGSGELGGGWSADGRIIVFGESSVALVDPITGLATQVPLPDLGRIGYASPSPTEEIVVVTSEVGVQLWVPGAATPTTEIDLRLPSSAIAFFSGDGQSLYILGQDDEIQVVDLESGDRFGLRGHSGALQNVETNGDDSVLGGATNTGEILLWDLSPAGPPALGNLPTEGTIGAIEIAADGSTVTVGESFGPISRVRQLDRLTGRQLAESSRLATIAFFLPAVAGAESRHVGGILEDGPVVVEDLRSHEVVLTLLECERPTSMDDAGRWIVVVNGPECEGPGGRVVEIETGATLAEWNVGVTLSDFGPSGTGAEGLVAIDRRVEEGFVVEIRRLADQQVLAEIPIHDVWRPFFSADGRYLTLSSETSGGWAIDIDAILAGADADDAIVLNKVVEGGPTTFTVAGGGYLITGHSGEVLRFWRLDTGEEWLALPVETGASTMQSMTSDGRYLYYAGRGGVVRRFPLNVPELAELARERVQRDFTTEECMRFLIDEGCSASS